MLKIYNVVHIYDVDGGFGDAISKQEVLFATLNKEVADKFVEKYSNPHIYDTPYANLYTGELIIEELPIVDNYNDIPKETINWGEINIKEKDVDPEELYGNPTDLPNIPYFD